MCTREAAIRSRRQAGISLFELLLFIVVVGVCLTGVLSVFITSVKSSADPMVRKQAISIGESLLEEIELQPFTICDPTDPVVTTAAADGSNCGTLEVLGPEGGQTRYSPTNPFNNVNDYHGFSMPSTPNGIHNVNDVPIPALDGYSADVTITGEAIGGVSAAESLRIDVRIRHGTDMDITLTGYRMRYAPRSP